MGGERDLVWEGGAGECGGGGGGDGCEGEGGEGVVEGRGYREGGGCGEGGGGGEGGGVEVEAEEGEGVGGGELVEIERCGREGLYVRLVDGWLYTHVKYITIHTVHYLSVSPLSPALSHLRAFLTVA